jgi:hypothetical protein
MDGNGSEWVAIREEEDPLEGPPLLFRFPAIVTRMLVRSLPAETVKFSVSYASEKCMPFVRCKPENRPLGVPAVANADSAIG